MNKKTSRLGSLILALAFFSAISVMVMMFGARLGFWEPIVGFGLIRNYMNLIGFSVLVLSVIGLIVQFKQDNRVGIAKTSVATLIALVIVAPFIIGKVNPGKRLPPIHDITTDTVTPPEFVFLDDSREGAKNTLVYGGADIAELQKQFYPDIEPMIDLSLSPIEAFNKALTVADEMGWEIVAQDDASLRFEAVARTAVYAFVDDVVVRVSTAAGGVSRIDIRSVSRIGRGDRGVNAERIRAFMTHFGK